MMSVPITCSDDGDDDQPHAERVVDRMRMKPGESDEEDTPPAPAAAATAPRPLMRPCAEITRIWRLTLKRSRITARQVVEHLGQVAARLALRQHRRHEEARVEHRHAPRHAAQRVGQRHAEVLLVVDAAELGADRRRHLVGDDAQAGRERVAGAQRAGDQVDGLGELLLEHAQPLGALPGARSSTGSRRPRRRAPARAPSMPAATSSATSASGDAERQAQREEQCRPCSVRPDSRAARRSSDAARPRSRAQQRIEHRHPRLARSRRDDAGRRRGSRLVALRSSALGHGAASAGLRAGRQRPVQARASTTQADDEGGGGEHHGAPSSTTMRCSNSSGGSGKPGRAPAAARTSAGCRWRGTTPVDPAVGGQPGALEQEDVLHRDDALLHAGDLGDGRDAARAVGQARELHDQVDGRGHLLPDGLARECSGWPSPPSCRGGTARRAGCWRGSSSSCRRGRCSWPAACRALPRRAPRRRRCDRAACAGR